MHELSIVKNILEIADYEVKQAGAAEVHQIDLEIGILSGIEMDALLFAWEACVQDTILATAKRNINRIPAKAKCMTCQTLFETDDYFTPCPDCGAYLTELIQGKELKIKQLIVS